MALRSVPGSRTYKADDGGFKELAQSPGMKNVMQGVGDQMAGNAAAVGKSTYRADAITVRAGWENEKRDGVSVTEVDRDDRDWRDAILVRVSAAMTIRGRR